MTNKRYSCEMADCGWTGMVRSTIRNRESRHYGKKVCPLHAKEYNDYKESKTPLKKSLWSGPKKSIKRITEKTKEKKKEQSTIRDEYFNYHLERCRYSSESGTAITNPTRANIAHILPKRKYKSVQADTDNCVYLTLEEHSRFDYLLDTLDFETLEKEFSCWPLVIQKFKVLAPRITEKGKLRTKFEEYLDKK